MATEDEVIRLVFKQDSSDLDKLRSKLDGVRAEMRELQGALDRGTIAGERYRSENDRLTASKAKLEAQLAKATTAVEKHSRSAGGLGGSASDASYRVLGLSRALQDVAQGGPAAALNNLEQIFGRFAGPVTIAATAIYLIANNWSRLRQLIGMGNEVPKAADHSEALAEALMRVNHELDDLKGRASLSNAELKRFNELTGEQIDLSKRLKVAQAFKAHEEAPLDEEKARAAAFQKAEGKSKTDVVSLAKLIADTQKVVTPERMEQYIETMTHPETGITTEHKRQFKVPAVIKYRDVDGQEFDTPESAAQSTIGKARLGQKKAFEFMRDQPFTAKGSPFQTALFESDPERAKRREDAKRAQDRAAEGNRLRIHGIQERFRADVGQQLREGLAKLGNAAEKALQPMVDAKKLQKTPEQSLTELREKIKPYQTEGLANFLQTAMLAGQRRGEFEGKTDVALTRRVDRILKDAGFQGNVFQRMNAAGEIVQQAREGVDKRATEQRVQREVLRQTDPLAAMQLDFAETQDQLAAMGIPDRTGAVARAVANRAEREARRRANEAMFNARRGGRPQPVQRGFQNIGTSPKAEATADTSTPEKALAALLAEAKEQTKALEKIEERLSNGVPAMVS